MPYPDNQAEPGKQSGTVFEEMDKRLFTDYYAMTTQEMEAVLVDCVLTFDPYPYILVGLVLAVREEK